MDYIELNLQDKTTESQVKEALKGFELNNDKVQKLKETFIKELEIGMKDGLKKSSLQMENTYVPELTNGKEQGTYLALDLGGTNFRYMIRLFLID